MGGLDRVSVLEFMTPAQKADVITGGLSVDVSGAFIAAQASGRAIDVPKFDYLIRETIEGQSYSTWHFGGGRLVTDQNITVLRFAGKQDFTLLGHLRLSGSYADGEGKGVADPQEQHGLELDACWKFHVCPTYVENFKGSGIRTRATASGWPGGYGVRGHIASVLANNSNVGVDTEPGQLGEYYSWGPVHAANNNYNMRARAGNHGFTGGALTGGNFGLLLVGDGTGTDNHLHGIIPNFQIKHNVTNVWAYHVTLGQDLIGCQIYDGPIELIGSGNIVFNAGTLDPGTIICSDGNGVAAGLTRFIGMRMPQGAPTISGTKAANVNLVGCF